MLTVGLRTPLPALPRPGRAPITVRVDPRQAFTILITRRMGTDRPRVSGLRILIEFGMVPAAVVTRVVRML